MSWKSSLKLPRSAFPARPNPKLQQQYLRECTDNLYQWQTSKRPHEDPFILHDGPPYANGPLHIGHAINKILKDIIIRNQIQNGRRVIYRPSWDCHGLPIEMKAIGQGNGRGMDPMRVRKAARALAAKTVASQMKEFKSFGIMADWEGRWTTMDRDYEIRQLRVFQKMVRGGLIYRKHKPIYWSTSSGTALAEAELEYREDHESTSAYVKFLIESDLSSIPQLKGLGGHLHAAVWTTTPWTLPANGAIAVHDELEYSVVQIRGENVLIATSRIAALQDILPMDVLIPSVPGRHLTGLQYRNKLCGAGAPLQPIIHADFVSAASGTGLVHLAPGHGQDDYEACSRLGIPAFAPINDEGKFTREAYPDDPEKLLSAPSILEGGSEAVLELVAEDVLCLQKIQHKYPYDWRTKQPVIIRATAQWFADVDGIKEDALESLRSVSFVPSKSRERLQSFIKGRSEWCISRQRAWGVPIPALYNEEGDTIMTEASVEHIIKVMEERGSDAWYSDEPDDPAWVAPSLQGEFRRGTDTMDVWFDSGSSWTEINRQVDVYLEGSDQHRGWFQSSVLTYIANQKTSGTARGQMQAPFQHLLTHGFALDGEGKKMSKSLGNVVSPQEVMEGTLLPPVKAKKTTGGSGQTQHEALGPDALRLWTASSDFSSDMSIGPAVLQPVHSALIKYRTILKMLLGSLHQVSATAPLTKLDQMALVQLSDTMKQVSQHYKKFEFHNGVQAINRWISTDLSAFYLEALKDRLYCGDGGGALIPISLGLLRMLAPITPLLVQEAWSHRPEWLAEDDADENPARQLYDAPLIDMNRLTLDPGLVREDLPLVASLHGTVRAGLEKARILKHIGQSLQSRILIVTHNKEALAVLQRYEDELDAIFVVSSVRLNEEVPNQPEWSVVEELEMGGTVHILPAEHHKCPRCWRYIVEQEGDSSLCKRCTDVVEV